jgi:DNA invertase Pin-like site-specific DNA recombinase
MVKDCRAFYMHYHADMQADLPHAHHLDRFEPVLIDTCQGSIPLFERPKGKQLKKLINEDVLFHIEIRTIDCLGADLVSVMDILIMLTFKKIRLVCRYPPLENYNATFKMDPTWQTMMSLYQELSKANDTNRMLARAIGVKRAKAKGLYTGRKKGTCESAEKFLSKPRIVAIRKELKKGATTQQISSKIKCSFATIDKVRKLIKARNNKSQARIS